MDLWVVAAATGAGYIAKYLQNSAGEKEELLESSSRDQASPFCTLARKKGSKFGDVFSRRDEDVTNENDEISDILTLNSWQENAGEKREDVNFFDGGDDVVHELETNRLTKNGPHKSKKAHGFYIKQPNPLERYRTTRLNTGYIFSPPPSPSTPFAGPLIAYGIINRDFRDSLGEFVNIGDDRFSLEEKNEMLGSRLCRQSGLVELPRTFGKHKVAKRRLNIASSGGKLLSQGPHNGMVLFFAGITIGILSSIIANKKEIDNMNAKLKQKENLVHDLREQIEMRDRLTTKEISNEDYQSLESTNRSSDWELVVSSSRHASEKLTKHGSKESDDQNVDNPELMSKIEAELEAELEKLELNITSPGLERISDYVELDPDFEADVQGDLKIHMARSEKANQLESSNDATANKDTHSSNYTVSPWELSLRLHEVIESRLAARIEELEQALKSSRKRHSSELPSMISSRRAGSGEAGSSSTPESHTYTYELDNMDPPLGISLLGEASDTYHEDFIFMADFDEETP